MKDSQHRHSSANAVGTPTVTSTASAVGSAIRIPRLMLGTLHPGWMLKTLVFMKTHSRLGIQHAFISDNSPKGNADTERATCTLEEGLD